jgi:hypothetical protein
MSRTPSRRFTGMILFLLVVAAPAWGWTRTETSGGPRLRKLLLHQPSDQDVILTISSIEWGAPDRWSFTSRYVHMFEKKAVRDVKPWLNNLSVTLSPGISGGRLGVGYVGIGGPKGGWFGSGLPIIFESRAVLLRTWGNPLVTATDRTCAGVELRLGFTGLVNVGGGYYRRISAPDSRPDGFWGLHAGVGI